MLLLLTLLRRLIARLRLRRPTLISASFGNFLSSLCSFAAVVFRFLLVPVSASCAADAVCSLSLHVWKAVLVSRLSLHVCRVCHFTFVTSRLKSNSCRVWTASTI
jgi:hypothetical protein